VAAPPGLAQTYGVEVRSRGGAKKDEKTGK